MSSTGVTGASHEAVGPGCKEGPQGIVDRNDAHRPQARDRAPGAAPPAGLPTDEDMVSRVGQLTRRLHDTLRELGYDQAIERAAAAIPDAKDRLGYVASMTEQAAVRTLTAVEAARPIQERIATEAARLGARWNDFFEARLGPSELWQLAEQTFGFLRECQEQTRVARAHLLEVMMAQEFQDLTGQVIRKVTYAAHDLEQQLVKLLLESVSGEKRHAVEASGMLMGPLVHSDARDDVVTSQAQVDDLLESLGF